MANTRPILTLFFFFAALLANAQSPAVDNSAQPPQQQAGAPVDPSTRVSEQTPTVPAASTEGALSSSVADEQDKPLSAVPPHAKAIFDQRYTQLRRGHDQEIAVLLCPAEPAHCWFKDASVKNEPVPLSLQMESEKGFTIRYGAPRHYESRPFGKPSYHADRRLIFLKVHANKDVSLSEHVLKGNLVFRPAGSAAGEPERLAIEVKVAVADEGAFVMEGDWPYIHHPGRVAGDVASSVGWAALFVVALPVLPIYGLIMCGSITCHD